MPSLEQIVSVVVAAVVAGVTAHFRAKKTTNGITGHIADHLSSKESDSTLREAVEEVRDTCAVVLANVQTVDRRLFRHEERIEQHLSDQDQQIAGISGEVKAVSARVTVLEKWKESA